MARPSLREATPARGLPSARQATLAVAGSQTGSRDGYIEHERLFSKIVWGVLSPLLANVYLHSVLDVWFERDVKPCLRGRAFLIRYADDFIMGFACEEDARRVLEVLPKRFGKYGLTLHPDKTRLVPFKGTGRPQRESPEPGGRAGTFDFLGFTHHWGTSRKGDAVVM